MDNTLEDHSSEEILSGQMKRKLVEEKSRFLNKRMKNSGMVAKKEAKNSTKNVKGNVKFCKKCNKKLKLINEFTCRCGLIFCPMHRFYDQHDCTFDYRKEAMAQLEKMNPKIVNDKITRV